MSYQQPVQVVVQAPETNGLGTAGFIVSLISFFLCGLSSPVGLLLSGLALFKRPRGLAIAGTILGLLGSAWLFIGGFAILAGFAALIFGASEASNAIEKARIEAAPPIVVAPEEAPPEVMPESPPVIEPTPEETLPPTPAVDPMPEEPPAAEVPAPTIPPVETAPSKIRSWASADGKFTVDAEFVSMTGGVVKLRKADGTELSVPREKLSDADNDWIKNR